MENTKKRLLFYIYSFNRGGAERVMMQVANYCKADFEILLLTDHREEHEYDLPADLTRIILDETFLKDKKGKLRGLYRILGIRKVIKEFRPDGILSFMASAGHRMNLATKGMHIPKAMAIRNDPSDTLLDPKEGKELRKDCTRSSMVVFQFPGQRDLFGDCVKGKDVIIGNPANPLFCNKAKSTQRNNSIVTVGRLFDYKNHILLIDAFSRIEKEFPECKVYIYGDGPYREETQKHIEKLSLQEKVFLPGTISNVQETIQDAALFVLPSDTEGMPNALMEAMLLGIPCVATDCPCGGSAALIRNNVNGLLVPMRDEEAMAEAMRKMLGDKEFGEMCASNAAQIGEEYSDGIIKQKWLAAMERLIHER